MMGDDTSKYEGQFNSTLFAFLKFGKISKLCLVILGKYFEICFSSSAKDVQNAYYENGMCYTTADNIHKYIYYHQHDENVCGYAHFYRTFVNFSLSNRRHLVKKKTDYINDIENH
ncbi:hypothetical protein GJ496_004710 [Pomphorhynchus laevis]|nr:hypothetical protein GJ496_004710 [Pomphorhynchus laevis]